MFRDPGRWTPRLLALAAGAAAALAHPPFGLLPGLLGYALLLHLIDTPTRRSAAFRCWLAGLGYFGIGVCWVVEPFMVDAANQGWMAPIAVVMLAGGLAGFWALAGLAYRTLAPQGIARVLVFAACLSGCEWLRGHVATGFPWNLPGEAWRAGSPPSQAAAWVGAYGLSWITIALSAAAQLATRRRSRVIQAATLAVAAAGFAALWGAGAWRLAWAPERPPADGPLVRIVQANIDQKVKWRPENLDAIFQTYVALSHAPAQRRPDVVVWPEGALPVVINDFIAPGSAYAQRLRDAVAPGQILLMGANRAEPGPKGETAYFNSLIAFQREAQALRVVGWYDKHRLVPFGEFMPAGDLAGHIGLRSLVHMPDDFTAGPPPRPLALPGTPLVQPLICYEALFPGLARGGDRAAWLLNISNDAWFGRGSGPLQHLNIASYRAIEQGLPIVRATPTGVSAIIDPFGRVDLDLRLDIGRMGVIDAHLPPPLAPTPYDRFGDLPFLLMLLLSAAPLALTARLRRRLGGT